MLLTDLGDRICILGPSNSGKSTLASAIARKRGLRAVHLDRLYHLPRTNWERRPAADFALLHDEAIAGKAWVMDGNYSMCLPQRLQRATGLILLDISTATSLLRYVRRTYFQHKREGSLEGEQDSIKLSMVRHIVLTTPGNRRRYRVLFEELDLPKVMLASARALSRRYREWDLAC